MSKKNRRERQDQPKPGQSQDPNIQKQAPDAPVESVSAVEPRYLSWQWYAKIFAGCVVVTSIAFFIFVQTMKSISRGYTEDGIAMYKMAKELQAQKDRLADTVTAELSALDAVVDIERLKAFILSDVAYKNDITEDTRAILREQDEKLTELLDDLRQVKGFDQIQLKIRDKTIENISVIQECVRKILKNADSAHINDPKQPNDLSEQNMKKEVNDIGFRNMAVGASRKISKASWYTQIAAGFFSWPAALDAAERSFFEALRFWQQNQEAAYWWGKVLDETAINDVASEKKIMAIKFDPKSTLADSILAEFKASYDAAPAHPRSIYNYAFALYRKGRIDESIPLYRKVADADPRMETFEGFLARRRLDIIEKKIDMHWYKTDDF